MNGVRGYCWKRRVVLVGWLVKTKLFVLGFLPPFPPNRLFIYYQGRIDQFCLSLSTCQTLELRLNLFVVPFPLRVTSMAY